MSATTKIWKSTKLFFAVISAIVMLLFISYMSISQNHAAYNIEKYLTFIGKVASISLVVHLVISYLIYIFSGQQHVLKNLDRISPYYSFILAIGLFGTGLGAFALLATKKLPWVELAGCLLVWGVFLNLYSIVSYRIIKRLIQSPE